METPSDISPIRHKVIRRLYEPLVLLDALGQVRGERIKPEMIPDTPEPNHTKLRRAFADVIAYICAYRKGPDHVTAAALEKTPQGVVVWLAANATIEQKVVAFLERILACVHQVVEHDSPGDLHQESSPTEQNLSSMIVDFQEPRLTIYRAEIIHNFISPCHSILADFMQKSVATKGNINRVKIHSLHQWLHSNFDEDSIESSGQSLLSLVDACYEIRHTQYMKTISMFAGQGRTQHETFGRLYKLLGKLGKPRKSANTLVEAATALAQDFAQGFTIRIVPSSILKPFPLRKNEGTIQSIVDRMFRDSSQEKTEFLDRLRSLEALEGREIANFLQRAKTNKTRVHAELLLIGFLERKECNFLDRGEKYIGCSKPACYLCHMYITKHPSRYIIPASHNKMYLSWRLPDVNVHENGAIASLTAQESILLQMIIVVRKDLSTEMKSRNMRLPFRTDSTTGITTSLASVHLSETSTNAVSYPRSQVSTLPEINEEDQQATSEDEDDQGGAPI